jgi:hypothetical protein
VRRLRFGLLLGCGALRAATTGDLGTVATDGGRKKPPTKDAGTPADGRSVSTKGLVEIIASGFSQPSSRTER